MSQPIEPSDAAEATPSNAPAQRRFPCAQCGARLEFQPGAASLVCPYCSHENAIAESHTTVEEHEYRAVLDSLEGKHDHEDCLDIACDACGASVHGLGSRTSISCPFCGSNIVATGSSKRLIKPGAILPFKFTREEALRAYTSWMRALWFAPSDLKRSAVKEGRLNGMYLPAWTYDSAATTRYTGQRGDAYYVTVPSHRIVNGKRVTSMNRERRIRWSPAAGVVNNEFDDVLVLASKSLPAALVEALEPWDTKASVPYDDSYLAGFAAESYQTNLADGFDRARSIMQPQIEASVRASIGGDEQRITSLQTRHDSIRFKHLLLPVWISAYRYRGKIYRLLINARTGEVRGDRPWSKTKISLAVIAALALIGIIALLLARG